MSRVTSLLCSPTHFILFRTFRGHVGCRVLVVSKPSKERICMVSPSWMLLQTGQHGSWDNTQCWQSLASNTVQLRGPTTPINSLASASSLGRPCFLTYAEALFRQASESIATASSGQFFLLCTAHRCLFPAPENCWQSHLFLSDDSGFFP